MKMESGPLSAPSFPAFREKVVPFLHITTQLEGRAHDNLLEEIGGKGFPSMRYMDGDGNVLGKPSANTVAAFESSLVAILHIQNLEHRIDAGEEGLEDDIFLAKLRMGVIPFMFAKAKAATFESFSDDEKVEVAQLLLNLEVESLLAPGKNADQKSEVSIRLREMLASKTLPTGNGLGDFWYHLLLEATKVRDIDLFERCLRGMKEFYGVDEETKDFFEQQDLRLQKMRVEVGAGD